MDTNPELLKLIEWNATKARIQISTTTMPQFPQRKQIWWASIGQNIGVEANGKNNRFERPVLVICVFNADSLLIAPLTSRVGTHKFLIRFDYLGQGKSINIFQLRTLSSKRFSRKMTDISDFDFERVLSAIRNHVFTKTETPTSGASSSPLKEDE
ncbi:MAG: type II toxin-antitoxin system PemK/MazF family toxin [Patescibacteria group bacterium]